MAKTEEDYLADLVGFESVSSYRERQGSKKCAQYCADFFESKGLHTISLEHNDYPSIITTSQNTKTPKVFLYCHLDVVPGKPELFKLKKKNGKLMGRGVIDMKFACASYMRLLDKLGREIREYDIGVMLVFDEEIGGQNGVEHLLKNGYGCEVCILPDSGINWSLEVEAKGPWFIKVFKNGKSAHGSLPREGINAAELLLPAINDILKLRDEYQYRDLSLSLTKTSSGKAMNQIPNYAEAVFDIRFRGKKVFKQIKSQVETICASRGATLETIEYGDCMNLNKNDPHMKKYKAIAEKVLGQEVPYFSSPGANDGRYFCQYGTQCLIMQPSGGGMHSDGEWIESGGMEKLTEINLQFIRECAKISR